MMIEQEAIQNNPTKLESFVNNCYFIAHLNQPQIVWYEQKCDLSIELCWEIQLDILKPIDTFVTKFFINCES